MNYEVHKRLISQLCCIPSTVTNVVRLGFQKKEENFAWEVYWVGLLKEVEEKFFSV